MRREYTVYGIIIVLLFLLQTVIFSVRPIFGIRPDLILVVVVIAALLSGVKTAITLAFFGGLLQSMFYSSILGIYLISRIITGGIAALIEGEVFKENYLLPPFIIFGATLFNGTLVFLLTEELLFNLNFFNYTYDYLLPEAGLNAVLGMFLYIIIYYLINYGGTIHG